MNNSKIYDISKIHIQLDKKNLSLFIYMSVSIYISAGLGDTILLLPTIQALKKRNKEVVGIFTTINPGCSEIFHAVDVE